jgi:hypothetical protein
LRGIFSKSILHKISPYPSFPKRGSFVSVTVKMTTYFYRVKIRLMKREI